VHEAQQENPALLNCATFLKQIAHLCVVPVKNSAPDGGFLFPSKGSCICGQQKTPERSVQALMEMNFSSVD